MFSCLEGSPSCFFLNKNDSNAIKGILIILIVYGHNHVLCPNTESEGMMEYLYTFHIHGFFILPFFYQISKELSWSSIGNIIVRNWVPYLWICIFCWLSYSVVSGHYNFSWEHVSAFLNGTQSPIRKYFGFVFPWFLPTYCSFSILLLIAKRYKIVLGILALLGLWTTFMSWEDFYHFKNTIPLGIGLAVNFFFVGLLTFYINKISSWTKYIGGGIFVLLSICWWLNVPIGYLAQLMPVTFFLLLLSVLSLIKRTSFIQIIGRYSLSIYLFHMFLINVMYRVLPHDIVWGWVTLIVCLIVPLTVSIYINKTNFLRIILFPRSWGDLTLLYKKNESVIL